MAVRPMQPSDYEGVNRLYRSVGWPERSPAGWRWLEANPARLETAAPVGWVIADETDSPAAVVGNLVQRFHAGERRLIGAQKGVGGELVAEQRGHGVLTGSAKLVD